MVIKSAVEFFFLSWADRHIKFCFFVFFLKPVIKLYTQNDSMFVNYVQKRLEIHLFNSCLFKEIMSAQGMCMAYITNK